MEIIINRLKESISTISLKNLYQLSQIINTEVLKRYKLGQLEGYFKGGDQIVFTDDDGCVLHGEVANNEEFHLLDPQYIFIKEKVLLVRTFFVPYFQLFKSYIFIYEQLK